MSVMFGKTGFMLVCLMGFTHATVRTGGLFNVVPLVASGGMGLSAGQIGSGFALGSLFGLAATYPAGMVADRFGRKPLIVYAGVLTGVSFFGFWYATAYPSFLVACVVWGIASAVTGAAPSAYAADNAPPGMNATAMSIYRALSDAGYVVGPIGLGLLCDLGGGRRRADFLRGGDLSECAGFRALRARELQTPLRTPLRTKLRTQLIPQFTARVVAPQ
jgi:MFS family permease